MPKSFGPQVITANDLIEGDSVFLGADGWVRDIARARVAGTVEEAARLAAAGAEAERANIVVGPYAVEVSLESGRPVPVTRRERIRAAGVPTIPVGPEALPAAAA